MLFVIVAYLCFAIAVTITLTEIHLSITKSHLTHNIHHGGHYIDYSLISPLAKRGRERERELLAISHDLNVYNI